MATYNSTIAQITCPRCCSVEVCEIDLYFGNTANMATVPIGTSYPFVSDADPANGGPIADDGPGGMGYTQCPKCLRDFHCVARIRNGLLMSVEPDRDKLPYIPDREIEAQIPCPMCRSLETNLHLYDGYSFGRLMCNHGECHLVLYVRYNAEGEIIESREPSSGTIRCR